MKNTTKSMPEIERSVPLKTRELKEIIDTSKILEIPEYSEENELEYEIDCPRCKDVMILCSEFDSLYYLCYNCDFYLYAIR